LKFVKVDTQHLAFRFNALFQADEKIAPLAEAVGLLKLFQDRRRGANVEDDNEFPFRGNPVTAVRAHQIFRIHPQNSNTAVLLGANFSLLGLKM